MLHVQPAKVMVGVAAHEGIEGALSFAAAEARRRGTGVHLVHVLHPVLVAPDGIPVTAGHQAVRRDGRQALADVAMVMERELGGELPVSTEVAHGHVAGCLADTGDHACVIVVQQRAGRHFVPTASMTNALCARSHVPVVVVPPGWREEAARGADVTVGVDEADGPEGAGEVLRAALEAARARGTRLRLVPSRPVDETEAAVLQEYADVGTEVIDPQGRPVDTLVSRSTRSSLLVIGGHQTSIPVIHHRHLDSRVREVLRGSACPVMVVEPPAPSGPKHRAERRGGGGDRPTR